MPSYALLCVRACPDRVALDVLERDAAWSAPARPEPPSGGELVGDTGEAEVRCTSRIDRVDAVEPSQRRGPVASSHGSARSDELPVTHRLHHVGIPESRGADRSRNVVSPGSSRPTRAPSRRTWGFDLALRSRESSRTANDASASTAVTFDAGSTAGASFPLVSGGTWPSSPMFWTNLALVPSVRSAMIPGNDQHPESGDQQNDPRRPGLRPAPSSPWDAEGVRCRSTSWASAHPAPHAWTIAAHGAATGYRIASAVVMLGEGDPGSDLVLGSQMPAGVRFVGRDPDHEPRWRFRSTRRPTRTWPPASRAGCACPTAPHHRVTGEESASPPGPDHGDAFGRRGVGRPRRDVRASWTSASRAAQYEDVCPSHVPFGRMVERARVQVEPCARAGRGSCDGSASMSRCRGRRCSGSRPPYSRSRASLPNASGR